MTNRDMVKARLELVAAKAKVVAADYGAGKYWSREEALAAMGEIQSEISAAIQEEGRRSS